MLDERRHETSGSRKGELVKRSTGALVLLALVSAAFASGCGRRNVSSSSTPNLRGERLAIEKGRLSELKDPIARTKSYILIADLVLTFVADAAKDKDHDFFRGLLAEYGRTIKTAKETVMNSEPGRDRRPRGYTDLEPALRRQLQSLQKMKTSVDDPEDRASLDEAIRMVSSIHDELTKMTSGA